MEGSRRWSHRDYGRDRYRHGERDRVANRGSYNREEKVRDRIERRPENGKVTPKEQKPQNQVALNNRSSSLSSSSSSFSTRGSDRNVDREPGELSSGSEGNGVPYEVHSKGVRISLSPKSSPLPARKRKYSPIVWDLDDKSPSKSYAAELTSAPIVENGSAEKLELVSEGKHSPLQNYEDEDEDVHHRVLSASRWADGNSFDAQEAYAEEFVPKKRGGEEIINRDTELSPELGELREESTHSAGARSSSVSDGETNVSLRIVNSEKKEDGVEGVTDSTLVDPMEIDDEARAINLNGEAPISSPSSDEDIEVDDNSDADCTDMLVVESLRRKINMLQGCRSVDEFERLNRINEGTYGVVYRARDKKTGEIVALKKVKMEKEREGFPLTSLREINILLSLHHPNIVDVKEVVVGNLDNIFMVMEYMDHDLKGLMEAMKQPFSQSEVKCLMLQLLEGVKCLHDNWVLHRDLKTSNLLMNNCGELKICDFGLARQYGSPLRPYTRLVVTLWYRAPELLLGEKLYSTAIDMWSVGCIMAEMLAKEPLFCGKTEIDQLDKIYRVLGTPNEMIWPGYAKLPGVKCNFVKQPYNKLRERFPKFTATFTGKPALSDAGFDLLNKLLTYDPEKRIIAEDALNHEWFREFPPPKSREFMPTFPALHDQDRRLWRVMKSPDPLEELRKIELQKGESLGTAGLFG